MPRQLAQIPLEQITTAGTGRAPDAALRESMARYGLLEPLDLRARPDATYELVAGSRRLLAARDLGWTAITAVVEPAEAATLSGELKAMLMSRDRRSLRQIHLARQARRVLFREGCSQAALARLLRIGRSTLCQMLQVLGCPDLVTAIEDEHPEFGAARTMTVLPPQERKGPLAELRELAGSEGRFPSVRQVEARVRARLGHAPMPRLRPEQWAAVAAALAEREIPVGTETIPSRRAGVRCLLRPDEASAAALRERLSEAGACSHAGTADGGEHRRSGPGHAHCPPSAAGPRRIAA